MIFDEMQWCTMKVHVKYGLLKEKSTKLAFPCESYDTLNLGIFWKWLDHILPTTHGNFMFLDFLEMGEQDLQLSCWTNFHLKLAWWGKLEEKTFPFLAISNYRSLTIFGNFSSHLKFFIFDVWNVKWDLYGHEWGFSNHLPPSNPWLNWQLTLVDFLGFQMNCILTDELWTSNLWPNHFKMIPRSHENIEPTLGLWFHGKFTCLLAQLSLLTSLTNDMQWTM